MSSPETGPAENERAGKSRAPSRSVKQIERELERTRQELGATIAELQDRLNVPKQARALGRTLQHSYQRNPVPWIASAAGIAAGVGALLIWGATRRR